MKALRAHFWSEASEVLRLAGLIEARLARDGASVVEVGERRTELRRALAAFEDAAHRAAGGKR